MPYPQRVSPSHQEKRGRRAVSASATETSTRRDSLAGRTASLITRNLGQVADGMRLRQVEHQPPQMNMPKWQIRRVTATSRSQLKITVPAGMLLRGNQQPVSRSSHVRGVHWSVEMQLCQVGSIP